MGADFGLAEAHKLYACHDLLLEHKEALFSHLVGRWRDLFNADFDVLLYDLTSTYFEVNASDLPEGDKRRHGYSRDKRPDCPQVVIALVVTPEGLPLAYEVLPGNTADSKTLRLFLGKIEQQYGKARRVWVMDRGVPTEAVLAEMRNSDPPVQYLVGTPKGRLNRLEKHLLEKPWQDGAGRRQGQVAGRGRRALRLRPERRSRHQRTRHAPAADEMAVEAAPATRRHGDLARRTADETRRRARQGADRMAPGRYRDRQGAAPRFTFSLNRKKLRTTRRREGRYLLRTNLTDNDPALLWQYYIQLVAVEEAFKNLKGDLAIRPIFHQDESRIVLLRHKFLRCEFLCDWSGAAWTSRQGSDEGDDQASAHGRNRVWNVAFGPQRRSLWVGNRRERQAPGTALAERGPEGGIVSLSEIRNP